MPFRRRGVPDPSRSRGCWLRDSLCRSPCPRPPSWRECKPSPPNSHLSKCWLTLVLTHGLRYLGSPQTRGIKLILIPLKTRSVPSPVAVDFAMPVEDLLAWIHISKIVSHSSPCTINNFRETLCWSRCIFVFVGLFTGSTLLFHLCV